MPQIVLYSYSKWQFWHLKILWKSGWEGRGGGVVFEVGNPEWRGGLAVIEIREEGGV